MALRSHLMAAVGFGPYSDSEIVLASGLWREVPDDSLMLVDRGFLAAGVLLPLNRDGKNRQMADAGKIDNKMAGAGASRKERRSG